MSAQLLIKIEGGNIQSLITNIPGLQVAVVDYDNEGINDENVSIEYPKIDMIITNLIECFETSGKLDLDKKEQAAYNSLKENGFFRANLYRVKLPDGETGEHVKDGYLAHNGEIQRYRVSEAIKKAGRFNGTIEKVKI